MSPLRSKFASFFGSIIRVPVTYIFQLSLMYLRAKGEDVRLVYDNPQGTLTFQGQVKYAKKIALPRRNSAQ